MPAPLPTNQGQRGWQGALALFVVFAAIATPLLGRAAWHGMENLRSTGDVLAATGLSLAVTLVILAGNVLLLRRAVAAGLPWPGPPILWLVTVATFALTVGTGFFSPVNLLAALLRG